MLRRASFATGDGHFLGFSGVLLDWDAQTRELDREARFEGMQLAKITFPFTVTFEPTVSIKKIHTFQIYI